MNQKIRTFVLKHSFSRELFFIIFRKKVNKRRVNKKIQKLRTIPARKTVDAIVSLTSYGERLNELQYTLYSLVVQTVRPKKIIVNLAERDFANLPQILRLFEQFGVEYRQTEDLKSYKKLIPTLHSYPEECIVTADDDLFYPKKWLERLWKAHLKNPNCAICHLTSKIQFKNGILTPYKTWKYNKRKSPPSLKNFVFSGAGILFPPHSLYRDVCETELFMKLSPFADDIWDYFMLVLNETKIMQIPNSYRNLRYVNPYKEYGLANSQTLTQINVGLNKNEEELRAVMAHYKLTDSDFYKKLNEEGIIL